MPQLKSSNLCFSFGSEPVLSDISLQFSDAEFVSILGASGCGKSTLLRLLAGLLPPESGSVTIDDCQNVSDVSFVFQKPTLCPWLSVVQNIELPIRLKRVPKAERRRLSKEAINLVGLHERDANKLPHQLSGGMQMRVSFARAFVTKPKVMLMDEPFSALDEVLRQQLCETCLDLWQREHWTTVFVTHNVSEAVFMSQRVYILAGKPSQIVDVVEVPFQSRTEDLRTAPEFIRMVSDVSRRLRRAVESGTSDGDAP